MIPQVFRFICGSGRWRIAAASILAFVPFPLFAETPKYENPLGCGITSIAQFIKGALTIIIKIGVPLGAVFLIWAGFLFVTAQGNETKLATAKKTFVWSCIGLAVLLGSWVLAVAVEGTIKKLGGGPVGGDVAADGGCDVGDPEPEKGKFFWHSDVELTQVELAESEMELFTSADTSSVKAAPSELYDPNLLMLFEYVLYHEKYLDGYGDTPDEWLEELIDDNPDDDVDCKYEGGIIYIQNDDLAVKDEQTFLYAKFNTLGNPTRWYIGPVGDDGSAPNPDALIASLLSDSITTLFDFHTHPYGASATEGQKISSPSIADLDVAYQQKKTFKTKKIIPAVIAQNAVWEYAIVNGGTYQEALHSLQGEVDKFFANSPKASIYFDKRYKLSGTKEFYEVKIFHYIMSDTNN
ncbi:MAG: hypothetical protein HYT94_02290 [Parcubacteria group bacterium]|nr:hypothetical protein [Parcubacteria group bacterium]